RAEGTMRIGILSDTQDQVARKAATVPLLATEAAEILVPWDRLDRTGRGRGVQPMARLRSFREQRYLMKTPFGSSR
ncbi:MAG: hypothetical protein ACM35G_03280, partial [Planctomycetaceae bacterium]